MEIVLLVAVVIGLIIGIINLVNRPSLSKFQQLGDIRGKTLAQVINAAGLPHSYSTPAPGKILAQWIDPGIHVALLFEYRGPKGGDWAKSTNIANTSSVWASLTNSEPSNTKLDRHLVDLSSC
jgi:hypothetical protein